MEYRGYKLPSFKVFDSDHFDEVELPIINECVEHFRAGNRLVMLQAPCGVGKTVIGECVRQRLNVTGTYTCSTRSLQTQFLNDYSEWAHKIQGRKNYLPLDTDAGVGKWQPTCGDCDYDHASKLCTFCSPVDACPYTVAKLDAAGADLACGNYAYLLNEWKGGDRSVFTKRGLLIADECVPRGTLIATPSGEVPIEDIQSGMTVWGSDKDGRLVPSRVLATTTRTTDEELYAINGCQLTGNHPVWTPAGYIKAQEISFQEVTVLSSLDDLYLQVVPARVQASGTCFGEQTEEVLLASMCRCLPTQLAQKDAPSHLSYVQEKVYDQGEDFQVLLHQLCQSLELETRPQENEPFAYGYEGGVENARGSGQIGSFWQKTYESNSRSCRSSSCSTHTAKTRMEEPNEKGKQRVSSDATRTITSRSLGCRMASTICCQNGTAISQSLHARHGRPYPVNSSRSRWTLALLQEEQGSRRPQGRFLAIKRLDRFTVPQQRSSQQFRGSGKGDLRSYQVFNLKTTTSNYFANRLLVHNCDNVEDELLRHITVSITPRLQKVLKINAPKRKTVESSWQEWLDYAIPHIYSRLAQLPNSTLPDKRLRKAIGNLHTRLTEISGNLDGWLYTYEQSAISFKPVVVNHLANESFWQHTDRTLAMSATIISPVEWVTSLGYEDSWQFVEAPSVFPAENRPIYFYPAARMVGKPEDQRKNAWPDMGVAVLAVLERYPDKRVLVHTNSYGLAGFLRDFLLEGWAKLDTPRPLFCYQESAERQDAIDDYERTPGAVLIASSLDRGYDGKNELCSAQIICKTPFMSLGDKQVSTRLYGTSSGQLWYDVSTVRTIVQMTGRAVRGPEDRADTWILDTQFSAFFNKRQDMFPGYWKEALHLDGPHRFRLRAEIRETKTRLNKLQLVR